MITITDKVIIFFEAFLMLTTGYYFSFLILIGLHLALKHWQTYLEIGLPIAIQASPLVITYLETRINGNSYKTKVIGDKIEIKLPDNSCVYVPYNYELKTKTINGIKLKLIDGREKDLKLIPGTGIELEADDLGGVSFVLGKNEYDSISEILGKDEDFE